MRTNDAMSRLALSIQITNFVCIRYLSEFGYNDGVAFFFFISTSSSCILFHLPYFMFVILKCMRIQLCTLFELKREGREQSKATNKKKNTNSTKTRLKSNPFAIARNFMHIKKPFVQALGLNDKRQRE